MFSLGKVVTNLPPNAQAQYKRVVASKSKLERLQNLRIFISMIPDHKGTEKLRANVKKQIARLEDQIKKERSRNRQKGRQRTLSISKRRDDLLLLLFYVNPETKVKFLSRVSRLPSEEFYSETVRPYSTRIGGVNMIFLPISFVIATNQNYIDLARQADGALFAASSQDEIDACASLINSFKKFDIFFILPGSEAEVTPSTTSATNVIGQSRFLSENDARDYLSELNLHGATIELSRFSTRYSLDAAREKNSVLLRFWVALDEAPYGGYDKEVILLPNSIPAKIRALSEVTYNAMDFLRSVLKAIHKIRVWTKEPRDKTVSEEPILLKEGASVLDLAKVIHGELAMQFKYAMLYRPSQNMKHMRVGAGFQLEDGDTIEIH